MVKAFARWLNETELGQYLLAQELAFFDRSVAGAFGYRAVQLGLARYDFLRENRIAWQLRAGPSADATLRCQPEQLPFASGSLDLLLLPHVLDFTSYPHQVLREAERVLVADGRLIITGFNPWSLWGGKRLLLGRQLAPWNGQFLSLPRIRDWLALMELEPDSHSYMAFAPPCEKREWLERLKFLDDAGSRWWPHAAGVYGISAVKRRRGMRLITPSWSTANSKAGLAVAGGNERTPVIHESNQKDPAA